MTWHDAPHRFLPFVPLPPWECPHCHDRQTPIQIRTMNQGDGSKAKRYVCRRCSHKSVDVLEPVDPAKVGKTTLGDSYTWETFGMEHDQ